MAVAWSEYCTSLSRLCLAYWGRQEYGLVFTEAHTALQTSRHVSYVDTSQNAKEMFGQTLSEESKTAQ